jgi:type VI secretion system ImpM family protein
LTRARIFGKLPAHGDFIARGMTMEERDAIDRWLAQSLAEAQAALGEGFAERYDRAPPWRCIIPDSAGEAWEAGALAPSIDSAGRRFPIYLGVVGIAPENAEDASAACEALLYDAFEGGWDVDALADAAAATVPVSGPDHAGGARWWTLGGEDFAPASLTGDRPAGLMHEVLRKREEPA